MKKLLFAFYLFALPLQAATVNITASFSPSMSDPSNDKFVNTTPQSGYCVSYPAQCTGNNTFSINMGGITASLVTSGLTANSVPRMGIYFGLPGAWRDVVVRHDETGEVSMLKFRMSAFSARYNTLQVWTLADHQQAWNGSSFVNAPSPCSGSGVGSYPQYSYLFMWKVPNSDVACYKTARKDLTGEPHLINTISMGYELSTPNPLQMSSGIYKGELVLNVGPGGEIDFGDNYKPSDTTLALKFTLSVNHELKLSTTAENQNVSLIPCEPGKVCTAGQGDARWERWMVNRITPNLTGQSKFNLSSSGSFTVYLQCEQNLGSDCALKSDKLPSQRVPVQALLTLPDNIVDSKAGTGVVRRRLAVGKDLTKNVFLTNVFGQEKAGSIDFLIEQKDVDTMLNTRPDVYRGAVTVIFDPLIH
ncbi:hypothetical protein ACOBM3_10150 [Enterobacter hormaechei]|uniref:hypothetical protein n=1 Tax=Enterobacter hormaechei TaxID=158836 RepID=UPI00197E89CC|nr:hypothetical protein [Enterobacter hormaechei]MBN4797383.1 hypothetical protein [Enterobacter hormaechei]MBN4821471.1 hypothetical protein [Enterobacter hormaechei]